MARSVSETDQLGGVRPFAAVVDLRMPGGPDGAALDRLMERFPGLPVLVMTGHQDAIVRASPHLPVFMKPVDPEELLSAVEKLWH
jgi:DNA-binding NtrC family response regulator